MKVPSFLIWQPKRSARQEAALRNALEYYNSDPEKYKNTMFCPYCGEPLVKSGIQRPFETLSEHVGNPNGTPSLKDELICSAKGLFNHQYLDCEENPELNMIGCEFGILHCWNDDIFNEEGGSYSSDYRKKLWQLSKKDIITKRVVDAYLSEDNSMEFTNALNSFECQVQTSIYNKGLKKHAFIFPFSWTFNIQVQFEYQADKFGRVTGIEIRFKLVKIYDRHRGSYCIKEIDPIHTWIYLNQSTKSHLKRAMGAKTQDTRQSCIFQALKDSPNKSWIYRAHAKWVRFKHPRLVKELTDAFGKDVFEKPYL